MPFNFATAKKLLRATVHNTLAVEAFYQHAGMPKPMPVMARWHTKIDRMGDIDNGNYAEIIESIDRVIFLAVDARELGVKHGGSIRFTSLGSGLGVALGSPLGGAGISVPTFKLDSRDPNDGPIEEIWYVTREAP